MALESLEKEVIKLKMLFEGKLKCKGVREMPYFATEGVISIYGVDAKGHYFGLGLNNKELEDAEREMSKGEKIPHYNIMLNLDRDNAPVSIKIWDEKETYLITRINDGFFGPRYHISDPKHSSK
jgi:hypothetical protein